MIEINKQALELTKQVCHEELDIAQNKYNSSIFQVAIRYLRKQIIQLMICSLFTMFIIIITSYKNIEDSIIIFIIYYAVLGTFATLEYMKSDYYHVRDILSLGYFNEGRRFLFTSCLFTVFEVINFIVLCIFVPMSYFDFIKTVLCALVPILIAQIISMFFIQYVHNLFGSIIAYFLSYMSISVFFLTNDFYQLISIQTVYIVWIGAMAFYFSIIMFVAKQRKGRKEIWNWY